MDQILYVILLDQPGLVSEDRVYLKQLLHFRGQVIKTLEPRWVSSIQKKLLLLLFH
jgi:hypothetical protein